MQAECSVFSPCGRYRVNFVTNGETELRVDVFPNGDAQDKESPPPQQHFVAVLDELQVLELTTAAGVRKSFRNFSEMVYNSLIGRAACVRFYVESCGEMKQRISADVRSRQEGVKARRLDGQGTSPTGRENDGEGCDETIDLSVSSDLAEDILSQRFLTIDYDVDFTRAVFPIPLDPATTRDERTGLLPVAPQTKPGAGFSSGGGQREEREELQEARRTMERLERENAHLREENSALIRLSKEKMLEMQRLCEDFQSRVQAGAEAERLRAKNAELRLRVQEAEEARAAAERSLEAERVANRRRGGSGAGSANGHHPNEAARRLRGSSVERVSATTASLRGSHSPNPYLRSLSRGSTGSVRSRAASVGSTHSGNGSRRGGAAARTAPTARRALVSPTPPPAQTRGSRSRDRPSHSSRNRFDTPPPAAHANAPTRQRQGSDGGGGGDSPAPRGRSGNRRMGGDGDYPLLGKLAAGGGGGGYGSDGDRSSRASSVGSRASSTASHERLFRTSTAASRSKQIPHAAAVADTPPRRSVFR